MYFNGYMGKQTVVPLSNGILVPSNAILVSNRKGPIIDTVLVSSGCYNEIPQTGLLK